jgi:hypothetical protein
LAWDNTFALIPQDMAAHGGMDNTRDWHSICATDLETGLSPAATATAGGPNVTHSTGQERPSWGDWAFGFEVGNLLHQRGILEEELMAVEAAIAQLRTYIHSDEAWFDPIPCSESAQKEVWRLLLDKDWRNASIRSKCKETGSYYCEGKLKHRNPQLLLKYIPVWAAFLTRLR